MASVPSPDTFYSIIRHIYTYYSLQDLQWGTGHLLAIS